jgi:alanine racemase
MPRPITATIHFSALKNNYLMARHHAHAAKVWAVVKANAYGHGLTCVTQALADADGFALVEVDYAVHLRTLGWNKPILLLNGPFHAEDIPVLYAHQFDIVVHSFHQIDLLEKARGANSTVINVHLKLNGGMNRLGFRPDDIVNAYQRLCAIKSLRVVELMMHFANADDASNTRLPVAEQMRRFDQAYASLGNASLNVSLSNSAGNIFYPSIKNNWVRAGIMLYGGSPSVARSAESLGLQPAMTLSSELVAIQDIQAGEAVGYGSRFIADKPMRIGVVACGYGDGYPRHAVNGTPVLVDGVRSSLVGCVSMDLITVDVTDIPGANIGSVVTLWGKGLPIDEVAHAAGTIGYELMCAVSQRVPLVMDPK